MCSLTTPFNSSHLFRVPVGMVRRASGLIPACALTPSQNSPAMRLVRKGSGSCSARCFPYPKENRPPPPSVLDRTAAMVARQPKAGALFQVMRQPASRRLPILRKATSNRLGRTPSPWDAGCCSPGARRDTNLWRRKVSTLRKLLALPSTGAVTNEVAGKRYCRSLGARLPQLRPYLLESQWLMSTFPLGQLPGPI